MPDETGKQDKTAALEKQVKELREDVRKLYAMQAQHGNQLTMLARAFVKKQQAESSVIARPKLLIAH